MKKIEFQELLEWAWAIRELPSSIEGLLIDKDLILAGDKEGNVVCWNHEGEKVWSQSFGNRVENFRLHETIYDANLFLVAGLEIFGVNTKSGKIIWKHELEGISDWVEIDKINETVVDTSSVFDIEYSDFLEGSYWIFSFQGELLKTQKMDEKTWHLHADDEGIFLGLGRPSNKIVKIDKDKIDYLNTPDSPICCGYKNIFGHANGSITLTKDNEITTMNVSNSRISTIHVKDNFILISDEVGELYCLVDKINKWKFKADGELALVSCFTSKNFNFVFACTRTDNGSQIYLLNLSNGELILESFSKFSIRTIDNNENMLLIGLSNGKIITIESDLLLRRIDEDDGKDNNIDNIDRKNMLEKLRNLRK